MGARGDKKRSAIGGRAIRIPRARYYDPKAGRFLSRDPIGFASDVNLYAYVQNNSVNRTDPLGLIWVTIGYNYPGTQNYFRYVWNRIWQGFDKEITTKNLSNLKREVIQEWQHDPQNPCRDKEHKIGTQRRIPQTFREFMNPGPSKVLINDPEAPFYYQWDPWVNSPTYDSY